LRWWWATNFPYTISRLDETALEGWLGFNDGDLAANRDGRLSSRQVARLSWSGIWRILVGPPLAFIAAVVAFVVDTAFVAVIALGVVALGLYVAWRGFGFLADAMDRAVAYVTGTLTSRLERDRYGTHYWATIGPVSKRISKSSYDAMPYGARCHLYYSPGCRSLLSVEPAASPEPLPAHPFGPDSAHAWDRLRWSWVLLTIGVLGLLAGLHQFAVAHAANPVRVDGTVADYRESHGRSTTRSLYLDVDSGAYTPQAEHNYTPEPPAFATFIGQKVTLYVDGGSRDVIAIVSREQLYANDWYLHPDHEAVFDRVNGGLTLGISALVLAIAVWMIQSNRRRAEMPAYGPPTVRPVAAMLPVAGAVILVVGFIAAFFGLIFAGMKY
jgi:hypothetical protein